MTKKVDCQNYTNKGQSLKNNKKKRTTTTTKSRTVTITCTRRVKNTQQKIPKQQKICIKQDRGRISNI